jgi:acetyl esterase/lipase
MPSSRHSSIIRLVSACIFFPVALAALAQDEAAPRVVVPPAGYTSHLDVTYVKVGDWEGKMDLFLPPKQNGPSPAIIKIHGGGWNHGTRVSPGGAYFHLGFALINVEYRFVQAAPAPAAIQDTRCALKYVISHAKELNIDPSRIVLQGGSAGGHLVLMTGLLGNDRSFDVNCPGNTDMKVAAIVDDFGPTDFTAQSWPLIGRNKSVVNWLGSNAANEAFKASVSPLSYVTRQSPPVIIFHGDQDHTVPFEQSTVLEEKLKAAGVKTELVPVPGAGHGKFTHEQNAMEESKIQDFLRSVGVLK